MEHKNTFSTISKSFRLELEADSIVQKLLMKENGLIRIKREMSNLKTNLYQYAQKSKRLPNKPFTTAAVAAYFEH